MYAQLEAINARPEPFEFYTAAELWAGAHTSQKMLEFHLNQDIDMSSRKASFIDRSVAWIVSRFGVQAGTRIADFGCGPGLYALRLAEAGARVTGIDLSANSIRYATEAAQARGLAVDYQTRDYLQFETAERFDLVLMIMCDYCALSPAQRRLMLTKFHTFLKPQGAVLLDVYSLRAFAQRAEAARYERNLLDGFWSPERYYGFLNTFKYEPEKVVLDKYTIVTVSGAQVVYNWLQYFSPEALQAEFRASGFTVAERYADVAGASFAEDGGEFAVVGVKAGDGVKPVKAG